MRACECCAVAFVVVGAISVSAFVTPLADRPDEPIPSGAMPSDWKEFPFTDAVAEPTFTERELSDGFLVFSRPITEPIYRETRPQLDERTECLYAFAARGERAQFNFAVYPARDIDGFSAVADSPFYARLEEITYAPFVYDHYKTRGKYRIGPAYLVPSAKTPLHRGEPLRYVLTMRVPRDAKPGRYSGVVRLGHAANPSVRELPFSLDVLPFELKQDPNRFRTAYVNRYYDIAKTVEYGFDIPGTIYINYDAASDRLVASNLDEIEASWRTAGGEPPRRYIALMGCIGQLYRKHTGNKQYRKDATPMPPDGFFMHLDRLGRTFLADWNGQGRPELFVIGADEPYPSSVSYVSRLFKTLKATGFRLFVTSWSTRDPKLERELSPFVDVWCDQFFVTPEERLVSGKSEHWCYPNHNTYEVKDSPTQSRGGRMTWGFGAWKMGDTTIVPWAWSWNSTKTRNAKIPQLADGMQVLKSDGTEWIEWFWEAIFAGSVDADYIYTLQDAVFRSNGQKEAKALLQELYDSVPAEPKYLSANHWDDESFGVARARIAAMIVKVLREPEVRQGECPSVLPDLAWHSGGKDLSSLFAREVKSGRLTSQPIPATAFYPAEDECKASVNSDGSIHCTITVDFEHAGNPAGYKRGSPSLMANLSPSTGDGLDMNRYAFLSYEMRVKSNRIADDAAKWPHTILFTSRAAKGKSVTKGLSGVPANLAADQWHRMLIPLSGLGLSAEERRHVRSLRWYFLERDYAHGDVLEFDIRNASLIGAERPLVVSFTPSAVCAGARDIRWCAQVVGTLPPDGAAAQIRLEDESGRCVAESRCVLRYADTKGTIRLSAPLQPGRYRMVLSLVAGDGAMYQSQSAQVECFSMTGNVK